MTKAITWPSRSHLRAWFVQTWLTLGAAVLAAGFLHAGAHAAQRVGFTSARMTAPLDLLIQATPTAEVVKTLVWQGKDVDGDGAPDFVNPTGKAPRVHDAYGYGAFGASRDGGVRDHEGVDYMASAGQDVVSPISGYVTKIGMAYSDDSELKFVEVTNPAIGYVARVFYVDPKVEVGQAVRLGQSLGAAHSLQARYPGGMTDHVHLELMGPDKARMDATAVLSERYVTKIGA